MATGGDSPPLHHQGSVEPATAPRRAIPLAVAALAFGVFAAIAAAVSDGLTQGADAWGLLAFRNPVDLAHPLGPAWLQASGRDFTGLGSNGVMAALVLAGSGLLAFARRRPAALFLATSFLGALALDTAIKHWVGRPRPELVPHAARVFTASFPSGHATVSSAACLAAALLLLRARTRARLQDVCPRGNGGVRRGHRGEPALSRVALADGRGGRLGVGGVLDLRMLGDHNEPAALWKFRGSTRAAKRGQASWRRLIAVGPGQQILRS